MGKTIPANKLTEIQYVCSPEMKNTSKHVIFRLQLSKDRMIKGAAANSDFLKVFLKESALDGERIPLHSTLFVTNGGAVFGGVNSSPDIIPLSQSLFGKVYVLNSKTRIDILIKNESSQDQIIEYSLLEGIYVKPRPQTEEFTTSQVISEANTYYLKSLPRPSYSESFKLQRMFTGLEDYDSNYRFEVFQRDLYASTISKHKVAKDERIILSNYCSSITVFSTDLNSTAKGIVEWELT